MFSVPEKPVVTPMLLTARQAAQALSISERTLATYTKSGLLPVVRIGHSVRYSPDDLRDWIKKATERKVQE